MTTSPRGKERLKVLITVKTYPIPSAKYDELVCTAGVTASGDFVRLYPINFRDLPFSRQYKKYHWIEVMAEKHRGRDVRRESYRPDSDTIQIVGEPIKSNPGNWVERARYALAKKARSMEELYDQRDADRTSLGVFKPKKVHDLVISDDDPDWKEGFKAALQQARLWDDRTVSKVPPRKVPFKFRYRFECDDPRCKGHRMMIEDWEVGALFWRLVDQGLSSQGCGRQGQREVLGRAMRAGQGHPFLRGDHPGLSEDLGGDRGLLPEDPAREAQGRDGPCSFRYGGEPLSTRALRPWTDLVKLHSDVEAGALTEAIWDGKTSVAQ